MVLRAAARIQGSCRAQHTAQQRGAAGLACSAERWGQPECDCAVADWGHVGLRWQPGLGRAEAGTKDSGKIFEGGSLNRAAWGSRERARRKPTADHARPRPLPAVTCNSAA
eukprot:jgi/Ulvmu1/12628/UM093_0021.1